MNSLTSQQANSHRFTPDSRRIHLRLRSQPRCMRQLQCSETKNKNHTQSDQRPWGKPPSSQPPGRATGSTRNVRRRLSTAVRARCGTVRIKLPAAKRRRARRLGESPTHETCGGRSRTACTSVQTPAARETARMVYLRIGVLWHLSAPPPTEAPTRGGCVRYRSPSWRCFSCVAAQHVVWQSARLGKRAGEGTPGG